MNIPYYEHTELDEVIGKADILYMTRVQRERFADPLEYEKVKNVYILRNAMLANAKENMRILHPLPRVNEIDVDVDENPKAYYFEQARNGVFARPVSYTHLEIEMPARQVVVNELEVIDFNLPDLTLRINCSKGTYIRSLANDIGQACESGAYLAGLRRTKIGSFQVEDANKMEDLVAFLQTKL